MTKIKELNPCPKCGGKANMKVSFGGATAYYGIYCDNCDHNNRSHNSAIYSHGLGNARGFPPQDRDKAIEEWNGMALNDKGRGE